MWQIEWDRLTDIDGVTQTEWDGGACVTTADLDPRIVGVGATVGATTGLLVVLSAVCPTVCPPCHTYS